jgi:hypothetical protein
MTIAAGTYEFGPEDGTLALRTSRTGAAAMAGHDLLLHVGVWHATVEVAAGGAPASVALEADGSSFRVIDGTGGIHALDDADRASILQTIDEEVLGRKVVSFRSTAIDAADGAFRVHGDLSLGGATHPLQVELVVGEGGALRATAVVKQSSWGLKPYSTLFGALKVADDVEVALDAGPPGGGG